jgi:hypothetical protein
MYNPDGLDITAFFPYTLILILKKKIEYQPDRGINEAAGKLQERGSNENKYSPCKGL